MGLSFSQALGSAADQWNTARKEKLTEQQTAEELALKREQMARSLQNEMIRMQIEQARAAWEQQRYEKELERMKSQGWTKAGQDYQNPDGTWTTLWYNPVSGEKREVRVGTPKASVIQEQKGDQALDLEKLKNKDKLEQIAASGRWHTRWSALAAQGKLKKEDWNALKTDPGYIGAISGMKNALAERNMILSRMYSPTNPPTPDQMAQLNTQLQQVEQRLQQSAQTAEQVRNRVRFGPMPDLTTLKNMVGAGVQKRTVKIGGQSVPLMADGTFMYQGHKYKANATGDGGTLAD